MTKQHFTPSDQELAEYLIDGDREPLVHEHFGVDIVDLSGKDFNKICRENGGDGTIGKSETYDYKDSEGNWQPRLDLTYIEFFKVYMPNAQLEGVKLDNALFFYTNMPGCNLRCAILQCSPIALCADMSRVNFSKANIQASFFLCDMEKANFQNTLLGSTQWRNCFLAESDFTNIILPKDPKCFDGSYMFGVKGIENIGFYKNITTTGPELLERIEKGIDNKSVLSKDNQEEKFRMDVMEYGFMVRGLHYCMQHEPKEQQKSYREAAKDLAEKYPLLAREYPKFGLMQQYPQILTTMLCHKDKSTLLSKFPKRLLIKEIFGRLTEPAMENQNIITDTIKTGSYVYKYIQEKKQNGEVTKW